VAYIVAMVAKLIIQPQYHDAEKKQGLSKSSIVYKPAGKPTIFLTANSEPLPKPNPKNRLMDKVYCLKAGSPKINFMLYYD
jgi:hypothetical protein